MKQKREIMFTIVVADDPVNETDAMDLEEKLGRILPDMINTYDGKGNLEEKFMSVVYCDTEWGEPV